MAPEAKKSTLRKRAKAEDSQRQRNKKRDEKTAEKAPESEAPLTKEKQAKSKKKKGEKAKAATIEGVLPTEADGDKVKSTAGDKKGPASKGTSKGKKPRKGSKEKIDFNPKKKATTQETAAVEVPDKSDATKDVPLVRADTPGAKSDARQHSKRDVAKKGKNVKGKKTEKGKKKRTGKSYMEGLRDVIDEKLLDVDAVSPGSESSQGVEARTPVRSRYIDPGMKAEPTSINADVLNTWASSVAKARVKPLLSEFLGVRKFLPENLETTHFLKHPQKNRYADVMCASSTRVVLKNREPDAADYIHANWVTMPGAQQPRYICTQGPMDETIEDFWHMVVQEKCHSIVMLCSVVEADEDKCAQYWPVNAGETLETGPYRVQNKEIASANLDNMQRTTLEITHANDTLTVMHYQWSGWPDQLAPADPAPVTGLIRRFKDNLNKAPVVVHCSAGIGRTGTFVAVDYAIEELTASGTVNMAEVIKKVREQRVHAVQTVTQYLFMHVCVLDYLVTVQGIPKDRHLEKFTSDYTKYLQKLIQRRETSDKRADDTIKSTPSSN